MPVTAIVIYTPAVKSLLNNGILITLVQIVHEVDVLTRLEVELGVAVQLVAIVNQVGTVIKIPPDASKLFLGVNLKVTVEAACTFVVEQDTTGLLLKVAGNAIRLKLKVAYKLPYL